MNKKAPSRIKTFDTWFWVSSLVFVVLMGIICFFPYWFTRGGTEELNFSKTGSIGDTIGGIMGPFIAMIASWLTFIAFWVQYKANQMQRADIAIERFEQRLFEMLGLLQETVNGHIGRFQYHGLSFYSELKECKGREIFQYLYEDKPFEIQWEKDTCSSGLKELFRNKELNYGLEEYVRDDAVRDLDNYFRLLYRIFKSIDDMDKLSRDEKYEYCCIVRATLSRYELLVLFYNCLSSNGVEKFKPLVERYAIFNNLRTDELGRAEHRDLYEKGAFEYITSDAGKQ